MPLAQGDARHSRCQLFANPAIAASRVAVLTGDESAHEPAATNGFIPAQSFGLTGSALVFGFHGFLSERKFSIHKVPLETYMSKLWVYVLTAPSEAFLIQPATMWKTHTPTVLVDAATVLSKRALPDEYRQLNPSSRSHVYPFSPMTSVASFSPH
jgi:hypothetical protein